MYRRFYLILTLLSSLVFLVVIIFAFYGEITPEWKKYQAEYKVIFLEKAETDFQKKKARSLKIEIQQIYLDSLGKVDRCVSCHLGVENPVMAKAKAPYQKHSGKYLVDHAVEKFGCTVCHQGQGRVLNTKEAHGRLRETHWDFPILPAKYIQSACAFCHSYKMLKQNEGEFVVEGERLFREKGCQGCHKLRGVGGVLGKELDGLGSKAIAYFPMKYVKGEKISYNWIKQHFDNPRHIVPESEMKVNLKGQEADQLTTFALTLKSEMAPSSYRHINWMPVREDLDGESLYKMFCIACHNTGKQSVYDEVLKRSIPAITNPAFTKNIDDRLLKKNIEDGRPDTQMTAWRKDAAGLTEGEIKKIIEYLTRDRPGERPAPFDFSGLETDLKRGKKLYQVRCKLCHGEDGKGGLNLLGINLRNSIVKKEASPEFLAINIRDGRLNTPMVAFGQAGLGLDDLQIADLVAYIRTLSDKPE